MECEFCSESPSDDKACQTSIGIYYRTRKHGHIGPHVACSSDEHNLTNTLIDLTFKFKNNHDLPLLLQ